MNTDIRLSVGFWTHPKTRKMIKRLGLDGVRSLQILWLWAAQNRPDGVFGGMDWEDIELAADWQGEEHAFFDHCVGVWIDEGDGVYSLHDWAEHNPWQAEALLRSEQNRQNAKSGWEKRRAKQAQPTCNAENIQPQCDCNATAKQPNANRNAPYLTLPVKEKESSLRSDSFCAELPDGTSPQHEKPDSPSTPALPKTEDAPEALAPVIGLPLNSGEKYQVCQGEVEQWQDLYPAVDVMQELRNMAGWLDGNPKKRKTKSGIKRFIHNWLAGTQNRGGTARASPLAQIQPRAPTEYQRRMQERRLMARMLNEHENQEERDGQGANEKIHVANLSQGGAGASGRLCT